MSLLSAASHVPGTAPAVPKTCLPSWTVRAGMDTGYPAAQHPPLHLGPRGRRPGQQGRRPRAWRRPQAARGEIGSRVRRQRRVRRQGWAWGRSRQVASPARQLGWQPREARRAGRRQRIVHVEPPAARHVGLAVLQVAGLEDGHRVCSRQHLVPHCQGVKGHAEVLHGPRHQARRARHKARRIRGAIHLHPSVCRQGGRGVSGKEGPAGLAAALAGDGRRPDVPSSS